MPLLQLYGSAGPDEENAAEDVANVSQSLVELSLSAAHDVALSGAWDNRLDATVKSFQANNGLDVDGVLLPGGPTQAAINRSLDTMRGAALEPHLRVAPERSTTSSPASDEAKDFAASSLPAARSPMLRDNEFTSSSRAPHPPAREEAWRRGDPELPRISERAAQALAESTRQRGAQFGNFLELLGTPRRPAAVDAQSASDAADTNDADRILPARGYGYVPDPTGRLGWRAGVQ